MIFLLHGRRTSINFVRSLLSRVVPLLKSALNITYWGLPALFVVIVFFFFFHEMRVFDDATFDVRKKTVKNNTGRYTLYVIVVRSCDERESGYRAPHVVSYVSHIRPVAHDVLPKLITRFHFGSCTMRRSRFILFIFFFLIYDYITGSVRFLYLRLTLVASVRVKNF